MPTGAHAAINEFARYRLHADGSAVNLGVLPAGVYNVSSVGTYVYDRTDSPQLQADAECSDGSASVQNPRKIFNDPIDTTVALTGTQDLLSNWHALRYIVNGDTLLGQNNGDPRNFDQLFFTGDALDDGLDIYVKGDVISQTEGAVQRYRDFHATQWSPEPSGTSLADSRGRIVAGCNLGTHSYDTVVVSDGSTPISLKIFEKTAEDYVDNLDVHNSDGGSSGSPCTSSSDPTSDCGLVIEVGRLL